MATRFLEGSVKHIVYNCQCNAGDSTGDLQNLEEELRGFNNPEYKNIRELFQTKLNFDILSGKK